MSYYLLPKVPIQIFNHIDYKSQENPPECIISDSLSYYLYKIKEKIEVNEKEWDIHKKYTNPYEYIHSNVPNKKKSIAKLLPLSRSFFKMVEIINTFDIGKQKTPLQFFHLAEGPGGFIDLISAATWPTNALSIPETFIVFWSGTSNEIFSTFLKMTG